MSASVHSQEKPEDVSVPALVPIQLDPLPPSTPDGELVPWSADKPGDAAVPTIVPLQLDAPPPPSGPPDGGLTAWCTVAGAWMIQFCTIGYATTFGVYQDYYVSDFLSKETSSAISWIGSIQLFLMYVTGVLVGRALDAGYFHYLEISGAVLYTFGLFMLSLAKPGHYYQVFLSQGLTAGLGLGLAFLPSLFVISHHFARRRSLALGIVASGGAAGGLIFPIMLNHLFANPQVGFANGVRASAGVVGALMLTANVLMRTRLGRRRGGGWDRQRVYAVATDAPYMWSIAGAFVTNMATYIPLFYLQLFASTHPVSPQVTTYILAILNAGSIVGRVLPPFLADTFGVYTMIVPSAFLVSVVMFAIFGATTTGGAIVVALLIGFATGAYIGLIPPLLGVLTRDMSEFGVRMGFAYSAVAVATLIGNPIAGALIGTNSGTAHLLWYRAIVFAGVCAAAGFGLILFSYVLFRRRAQREKAAAAAAS